MRQLVTAPRKTRRCMRHTKLLIIGTELTSIRNKIIQLLRLCGSAARRLCGSAALSRFDDDPIGSTTSNRSQKVCRPTIHLHHERIHLAAESGAKRLPEKGYFNSAVDVAAAIPRKPGRNSHVGKIYVLRGLRSEVIGATMGLTAQICVSRLNWLVCFV